MKQTALDTSKPRVKSERQKLLMQTVISRISHFVENKLTGNIEISFRSGSINYADVKEHIEIDDVAVDKVQGHG